MNITKYVAIAYSYPSSTNAERFGFATHGCYTVEISTSKNTIPEAVDGFDNSIDAFKRAAEFVAKGYIHSPYSISPEFRVYRPLP